MCKVKDHNFTPINKISSTQWKLIDQAIHGHQINFKKHAPNAINQIIFLPHKCLNNLETKPKTYTFQH